MYVGTVASQSCSATQSSGIVNTRNTSSVPRHSKSACCSSIACTVVVFFCGLRSWMIISCFSYYSTRYSTGENNAFSRGSHEALRSSQPYIPTLDRSCGLKICPKKYRICSRRRTAHNSNNDEDRLDWTGSRRFCSECNTKLLEVRIHRRCSNSFLCHAYILYCTVHIHVIIRILYRTYIL